MQPAFNDDAVRLHELPLFAGLSAEETEKFVTTTCSTFRKYTKGSRIARAYETNPYIGVLVSGEAVVISEDRFGNESIGHALARGMLFGSVAAILGEEFAFTSVEVRRDAQALLIPYHELLLSGMKLGRIHGIVMKNLLALFARKSVLMMQKIEVLSQKSLRERLILYLMQQSTWQHVDRVRIASRSQLAKSLECNRSALVREIGLMVKDGLLACGEDWMELMPSALESPNDSKTKRGKAAPDHP